MVCWEHDSGKPVVGLIKDLIDSIGDRIISKKFIYVLKQEFEIFSQSTSKNHKDDEIFSTELKRTLRRSIINEQKAAEVEKLGERLNRFYESSFSRDPGSFISFLEVCNAIGQEMQHEV